jgi:hypothetical protein
MKLLAARTTRAIRSLTPTSKGSRQWPYFVWIHDYAQLPILDSRSGAGPRKLFCLLEDYCLVVFSIGFVLVLVSVLVRI